MNSLSTTPRPVAEGTVRPVDAARIDYPALPGVTRNLISLPLTTESSRSASPATTRDDGVVAGDAIHFPTPNVGDGPS